MKSFSLTINGLQVRRYDVTATYHVTPGHYATFPTAGLVWETPLPPPTYDQLIARLRAYLALDSSAPAKSAVQRFRNHISSLHSFLAYVGKTSASRVGAELGTLFDDSVRGYLAASDVSPRSKRDRRAHLVRFKKLSSAAPPQVAPQNETPLAQQLRAAVSRAGIAPKTLAKEAGISPSALQRWLKGAMPNRRGLAPLRRLELHLGLPREQLAKLVTDAADTAPIAPRVIRYRETLQERKAASLMLPETRLDPAFLHEWRALFHYKTSALPVLNRHRKGVWRMIPKSTANRVTRLAVRGDWACPTADFTLGQLRLFLGVIEDSAQTLGISDIAKGDWQTLAWLAHRGALAAALNYLTDHAGGLKHNAQKTFCAMASALLRPGTGYLWQQPQFRLRLPESERPNDDAAWHVMCERSHTLLRDFKSSAKDLSRLPQEPIEDLLALADPLSPILQAITRLDAAAANAPPGSISEARHYRDALLLSMLVANPLRARTYISMTWSADQGGVLRGTPDSGWRIHLQRHHLKNGSGRAGLDYAVRVASWVQPRLTAYIAEYRATLLNGSSSPYLFPGKEGGAWFGMPRRVRLLTRCHIPGSPGFGPHAFRHLVATAWLRKHPDDFLTVSELLNDRLQTVLDNYAHLKRDTSFSRYEEQIETLLRKC